MLIACCDSDNTDSTNSKGTKPKISLLLSLPDDCNTPDGAAIDAADNLLISMPNFGNETFLKQGDLDSIYPAKIVKITPDNLLHDWYVFEEEVLHSLTKKVGAMDCAFGPDSNFYVNDNQLFLGQEWSSRLLRINCENGKPVNCEVIVEGFNICNGMVWKDSTLYITDSNLGTITKINGADTSILRVSGVYAFTLDDLNQDIINLNRWKEGMASPYLFSTIESSNKMGFGADGICFDNKNNLYVGTFEDGNIYKISLNSKGKITDKRIFASLGDSASSDGIVWREEDESLYVVDMLRNAVIVVDKNGNYKFLHRNGDTDGSNGLLDQPAEIILRKNEAIVINMDTHWDDPTGLLINTRLDKPITISTIDLE